jgi:hypothetical protein
MSGPIPIHNVPSPLNLPSRTNRDQDKQRKKPGKQAMDDESGAEPGDVSGKTEASSPGDGSQHNHIGTQIDLEA